MANSPLEHALDARVAEILDRCTTCGACVEVCPMPGPAGIDPSDPKALVSGVLALLRGRQHPAASERWAMACTGSGHCIAACQHGVNPRFMLAMARLAREKQKLGSERRRAGSARFAAMSTGVRVLSRMQLASILRAETPSLSSPRRRRDSRSGSHGTSQQPATCLARGRRARLSPWVRLRSHRGHQ